VIADRTVAVGPRIQLTIITADLRPQIRSPHTSARSTYTAVGSLGTRLGVGGRTERHCADSQP